MMSLPETGEASARGWDILRGSGGRLSAMTTGSGDPPTSKGGSPCCPYLPLAFQSDGQEDDDHLAGELASGCHVD